jgi:Protein of unknown function (DUF3570)
VKARPEASACRAAAVGASRRASRVAAVATGLLVAVAGLDWAQNDATVQLHSFQDSRGVTVVSPTIDVNRDFTDRTALRLKFGVDAITAASDSCARCHPEGANNGRVVASGTLIRKYGDAKWSVGGEVSRENFYGATTMLTSYSRDLAGGNTSVAAGFALSVNRPQLHPSEETERQIATDVYGSITQTLTKKTIAQVGYELNRVSGFQTSPFLRTQVNGVWTLGHVPDLRTRHAVSARLRQALPADTFLQADYRYYFDSWAIDSHTISLGLSHRFSPQWLVGGTYRWYDQTAASFYQPAYVGAPEFYTGDFRLVPFDSNLYSGRVVMTPRARFLNLPSGTELSVEYERYLTSNGFESAIVTGGVHMPF